MRNTFLIWIPSVQQHMRFYELSNDQYRIILKNISDDSNINFIYNINKIIESNLITPYDYRRFTVIDRFIIFTYFKIQFADEKLQLTRSCNKCDRPTNLHLDLNNMLVFLRDKLDRSFQQEIDIPGCSYTLQCDIPNIYNEYEHLMFDITSNVDTDSIDYQIQKYVTSYIIGINHRGQDIRLDHLPIIQQQSLISQIPHTGIAMVHEQYTKEIHDIFGKVVFFQFKCACGETFELKMRSDNIIDITKLLYRDQSLESWLYDYVSVAHSSHLDGQFLNTLSRNEMDIIMEHLKPRESQSAQTPSPSPENLFTYHDEISHMESRPSDL